MVKGIHDRMPVIIADEQEYNIWHGENNSVILKKLLRPYSGLMVASTVASLNLPSIDISLSEKQN